MLTSVKLNVQQLANSCPSKPPQKGDSPLNLHCQIPLPETSVIAKPSIPSIRANFGPSDTTPRPHISDSPLNLLYQIPLPEMSIIVKPVIPMILGMFQAVKAVRFIP
ncbi:hypothetical protein CEXT_414381 [Caerostris extrusa]|uniref:Uncharacterized protein n=1 Tax=Caerostris extrusa TaxID=172846 RepID=A0AAV4NQZ1_CAEEX|nr:hypothetical protein CEXT_414381 [Caerostris extrusa]